MLGAIHMVACLMPSVCVMICGGPGAQPASPYAWAHPLMGVSPMHASNRPFGWPAADMRRHGLLPEGLPLRVRARIQGTSEQAHLTVLAESLALQLRLCSSQAMERRGRPAEVKPLTGHSLYTRERVGAVPV